MTQEIRNMPFDLIPPHSIHTAPPAPVAQNLPLWTVFCRLYGSAIARRVIGGVLLGLSEAHWCGWWG